MKFSNTETNLSLDEIKEFTASVGGNLPEAFKSHYLAHNRGYPENVEKVVGARQIFPFHGFLPLKYGALPIGRLMAEMRDDFRLDKAVPFGYDPGGNIFYLSIDPDTFGAIYQITGDTREKFAVCDDFASFISGLRQE